MTVKRNQLIGEEYSYILHSSGLPVYVFPKKHSTAYAILGTKFGSIDTEFRVKGEKEYTTIPEGVAHFLEHKLFEEADGGDAFTRYAEFGGNANAYTSFTKTAYLFSCTDNFDQNLEILLDFVSHPHFTEATVKKEQGIIGEEIKMYDDNPGWQSFFGMVKAMYVNHPIRSDIAGTIESIAQITPEMLYRTYECFYNPCNMALCVCGDVTPERVLAICDKILPSVKPVVAERRVHDEPDRVCEKRVEKSMDVGQPIYSIGIKEQPAANGSEAMLLDAANEILLGLLFGRSSDFYSRAYDSGLINERFDADYSAARDYAFIEIGGAGDNPDAVLNAVCDEIAQRKANFFTEEEFERTRRTIYADNLFDFDSTDSIANSFLSFVFDGSDMLDYASLLATISYDEVKSVFMKGYNADKTVLSVINPRK